MPGRATRRRVAVVALAALLEGLLAGTPGTASADLRHAPPGQRLLAGGIAAYDALDYPSAIVLLEQALAAGLSKEDQLKAWDYVAYSHVGQAEEAEAVAAFQKALAIDPAHAPPSTISPRIQQVFERAKGGGAAASSEPTPAPGSGVVLYPAIDPPEPTEGAAVTVSTTSHDTMGRVVALRIHHRRHGGSGYSVVEATHESVGAFAGTIPGMEVRAPALEYYVEGLDEAGAIVANRGTAEMPLSVTVRQPTSRSSAAPVAVWRTWWFWTIVGGVVAGTAIGVGAYYGTRGGGGDEASPATVTIVPR